MSKSISILSVDADREKLLPVLDQLRTKGMRVVEKGSELKKDDIVLAALSEQFYADDEICRKLLDLVGAGAENVFPVQLDSAEIPDTIKNALYARNIIPAAGRDAGLIAERITAALPKKKSRLPLVLVLGALVLAFLAGFWFWRNSRPAPAEENPAPTEEPEPTPTEPPIAIPAGLTEEDLAEVRCVVIIGEHFSYYTPETRLQRPEGGPRWPDMLFELASADQHPDSSEFDWYWHEDGSKVELTPYDLSFLKLMPNLEELHMAMVDVEQAPDLSGLEKLDVVWAMDCRMDNVNWLAKSNADKLQIRSDVDYTPLGTSETLQYAILDVLSEKGADLSSFSPPHLYEFDLCGWGVNGIDLSGLSACTELHQVRLSGVTVRDLSFLEGRERLTQLRLNDMRELRDISALSGLTGLKELRIEEDSAIGDFSPISSCTGLEILEIFDWSGRLQDVSFLSNLTRLSEVSLFCNNLRDLNFLNEVSTGLAHKSFHLSVEAAVGDYSGLAAIHKYGRLSIDARGKSLEEILPWLEEATVQDFCLRGFGEVDLSALPTVTGRLELDRCDNTDLTGLREDFGATRICLNKLSRLSSLSGLEKVSGFIGYGNLEVFQCPRLTDWSALEGMKLSSLEITGGYTLPDFAGLQLGRLKLDSVVEVTDLSFLDVMDSSNPCSFTLVGLDEVKSLEPLGRFHGTYLAVQPQLLEQAEDLVKAGNFKECRAEYPQGGWEMDFENFTLLSLEELETLPKALLRRVGRLCIVGDTLVDLEDADIWEDWSTGGDMPTLVLHNWKTDEETALQYGKQGIISDFGMLEALTGLHELRLYCQPLENLDGIQNFGELNALFLNWCPKLTDASAAYTLQNLNNLSLKGCPVTSIQGVQNFSRLMELDINNTRVTDLTPLTEVDYSAALQERNGFRLFLNGAEMEDYAPLSSVPMLDNLDINDAVDAAFLPFLEGVEVHRFAGANVFMNRGGEDSNALFADFVRSHPQLTELAIPWNQEITDLTPVLELEHLEKMRVSYDMKAALQSLDGKEYGFQLEIDG